MIVRKEEILLHEKEATVLGTGSVYIKSSQVSAVTVIRLHFMDIKGDVYNLGVVSDRVSPDDTPDAFGSGTDTELPEWVQKLLMLVGIILLLVIFNTFFPFVKFIFSLIWTGIKTIVSIFAQ